MAKQDQQQLTIGGNNNIQTLRRVNHPHGHRINKHLIMLHNTLILLGNLIKHLIPQHHPVPLRITLSNHRQLPPRPRLRSLKRKPHNPLDPDVRKNCQLRANGILLMPVSRASLARILALGILTHDHPIQLLRVSPAVDKRTLRPGQDSRRPDVRPLVQFLADRQDHVPERDVVGHGRPADRAKVDCVVGFEGFDAVGGHVPAALEVGFAAPVVVCEGEAEGAVAVGELVEDFFGGCGDIDSDTIAGDRGDFVEGR
jgi:hypothetical protein